MIEYLWIVLGVSLFGVLHSGVSALRVKNGIIDRYGKEGYSRIFNAVSVLSFILALLSMQFWDWLYFITSPNSATLLLVSVGAILVLLAMYLAMLASRVISVSTVADMRTDRVPELVTDGLYGRIRHPLYLATILMFGGLAFIYPFPRVIIFALGMIVYTMVGALLEERKLILHYGEEYLEYKKRAGFILPRLGSS